GVSYSHGYGDVRGSAFGHLPAAGRRLPALRLRNGVLDRPVADHTGVHTGDHLRAVRAGGVRDGVAEAAFLSRGAYVCNATASRRMHAAEECSKKNVV
ncbi:unnamed protein product, partial [Urochloa humidicola]